MPYIPQVNRESINLQLKALDVENWLDGDLAYALFRIFDRWPVNFHFASAASLSGIVTETLAEWRRRRIVPYEKQKIKENGDVNEDRG